MSDPEKKKSFLTIFEEMTQQKPSKSQQNGHPHPIANSVDEEITYEQEIDSPHDLTDEIDHQILMHRDAHFGGDFSVMIDYYQNGEGIGVHPDLDLERIMYLAQVETELGQNLAPLILTGPEAEEIAQARSAYEKMKELYEIEDPKFDYLRLIADLVLSEEEEPTQEIEAVVAQGTHIIPELLTLITTDETYNSLFPGYGYAPYFAVICLGRIGDARAIIPIFEILTKPILFDDLVVLEALAEIGMPAQDFLLSLLKSRPLTQDNTHAAFALTAFSHSEKVAIACFEQLKDPIVRAHPLLCTYLLCNCEQLKLPSYQEEFVLLKDDPATPSELRIEIQKMIDEW